MCRCPETQCRAWNTFTLSSPSLVHSKFQEKRSLVLRTLTCTDGSTVIEHLEVLDGDTRKLSHVLLTDTPFRNCLATMAICGQYVNWL
jgi:ubiquitin C-terminal hydrolase